MIKSATKNLLLIIATTYIHTTTHYTYKNPSKSIVNYYYTIIKTLLKIHVNNHNCVFDTEMNP